MDRILGTVPTDDDLLAARFEETRPRLRAVAYRMLGSAAEAEDAVQEAWIRLSRSDASAVENPGGWLTTVVARVCLDMLRSRTSRREEALEAHEGEELAIGEDAVPSEKEMLLADSIGLALQVVLDTLGPAERVAFVLHDLFDLPFDEIAPIVGRSAEAARQLASRARRRVRGASPAGGSDRERRREVVAAFLAAARSGDFEALLAVLAPEVVVRADAAAARLGAAREVRGAAEAARGFAARSRGARAALVDGVDGAAWAPGGTPRVVFLFTVVDGKVAAVDLVADPDHLARLDVVMLEAT